MATRPTTAEQTSSQQFSVAFPLEDTASQHNLGLRATPALTPEPEGNRRTQDVLRVWFQPAPPGPLSLAARGSAAPPAPGAPHQTPLSREGWSLPRTAHGRWRHTEQTPATQRQLTHPMPALTCILRASWYPAAAGCVGCIPEGRVACSREQDRAFPLNSPRAFLFHPGLALHRGPSSRKSSPCGAPRGRPRTESWSRSLECGVPRKTDRTP